MYHPCILRTWLIVAAISLGFSCAPESCTDEHERKLGRAIEILVESEGSTAAEAEDVIAAHGWSAIAVLETAFYTADSNGRTRLVRALVRIGHPEVIPILQRRAEVDESETVRAAAAAGLEKLGGRRP